MAEILDSGQRSEFPTGFVRDMHEGKGRFDLLPWNAIWEGAKHCENGAIKYGERNIDKGAPQHSLIDSAIRHLAKYLMGWDDEPHLRAAWWNVSWALEQDVVRPEMQDIPSRMKKEAVVPHDMMMELVEKAKAIQEQKEKLMEEHVKVFAEGGLLKPLSEDKKHTNGDRIRAMSDEELAHLLYENMGCTRCPIEDECPDDSKCEEMLVKYLKRDEDGKKLPNEL